MKAGHSIQLYRTGFLLLLSLVAYIAIGYFTHRNDSEWVVLWFTCLFSCYYYLLFYQKIDIRYFYFYVISAIIFRLSLLFQIPNLSDDCYRFIFDGHLVAHGINPYTILPHSFILTQEAHACNITPDLYAKLNSPHYFTVYPAVLQYIFGISSLIAQYDEFWTIVCMRIFILLAEGGSFLLILSLLEQWNLPKEKSFIYLLNPLVIVELTGNLHFEALLLFFLLLFFYFIQKDKVLLASLALTLSIACKLIPLLFLPLIFQYLGKKKAFFFSVILISTLVLLFIPFVSFNLLWNILSSVGLYFHTFEFNASIFYLLKVGLNLLTGLDSKHILRIVLPLISTGIICYIAIKNKSLKLIHVPELMLLSLFVYYLLSTTIHPWYLTLLVLLSIYTQSYTAIVWSAMAVISYVTYRHGGFNENLYLISLEYLVIVASYYWETRSGKLSRGVILKPTQIVDKLI